MKEAELKLSDADSKWVQTEVYKRLGEYKKLNTIIKEDIFHILELNAKVLYYPIHDDEICGFYYPFKYKNYVFINTYIPLEKQLFAAAHELYHIWYSPHHEGELLQKSTLEEIGYQDQIQNEDLKANRFAAEFLVQKDVLQNELELRNIKKDSIQLREIVELMDIFLVPYKTIIRRLYEIHYLSFNKLQEFLQIPDRIETQGIMLWQKRLRVGKRNNERTLEKKFHNMVDMALELYEKKYITYEKLEYLLGLSQYKPLDFNIVPTEPELPSEDEIIKAIEEDF